MILITLKKKSIIRKIKFNDSIDKNNNLSNRSLKNTSNIINPNEEEQIKQFNVEVKTLLSKRKKI